MTVKWAVKDCNTVLSHNFMGLTLLVLTCVMVKV